LTSYETRLDETASAMFVCEGKAHSAIAQVCRRFYNWSPGCSTVFTLSRFWNCPDKRHELKSPFNSGEPNEMVYCKHRHRRTCLPRFCVNKARRVQYTSSREQPLAASSATNDPPAKLQDKPRWYCWKDTILAHHRHCHVPRANLPAAMWRRGPCCDRPFPSFTACSLILGSA
jgi:hypothetical protein